MIDGIVFSIGGTSGICHVGCVKALEECGELNNLKSVVGISAGSIIGCLVVLKYSFEEIKLLIETIDFKTLFTFSLDSLLNIETNLGIDNGEKLKKVLQIVIEHKTQKEMLTFKELYDINPVLFTTGSVNITTGKLEYFNKNTSPNLSIYKAVMMSSSIPILFNPITYNGNLYVDGGILGRYPINNPFIENCNCCIGFKIDNVLYYKTTKITIDNYIIRLINTLFINAQKYEHPTTNVFTVDIKIIESGFNFKINSENKQNMITEGYEKTKKAIINLRLNDYKSKYLKRSVNNAISKCLVKKKINIKNNH
jgi:NTE family protein